MTDIASNTTTTASLLINSSEVQGSFAGQIEQATDVDWLRFEIGGSGVWNFFAHFADAGGDFGDARLALLDATGTSILASDDDSGAGLNAYFSVNLNAGLYYLQIEEVGGDNIGSYTVTATLGTTTVDTATATASGDVITASAGGTHTGYRGADTIDLSVLGQDALGEQGDDNLLGNALANRLFGGLGNDTLNGLGANDVLYGDAGDDWLLGGAGNDELNGGDGIDKLSGEANDDVLRGGDGSDWLLGGAGTDTLNGGTGDDVMEGGDGGDAYNVDSASDVVVELLANTGTDTVISSISYVLDATIENLILVTSTSPINGTGNSGVNTISGNSGANSLDGGAGGSDGVVDTLRGFGGNDTYVLGDGSDSVDETVFGSGGIDTITSTITRALASYTDIENLTLLGTAAANATGTAGANRLTGNSGANKLEGGNGKDTLIGGGGGDRFVFKTAADSVVGANHDTIKDFSTAGTLERIDLSAFAGTFAFVGTGAFAAAGHEVGYKFVGANTLVKVDLDGDAASEMEIMLTGHKVLTATDFYL